MSAADRPLRQTGGAHPAEQRQTPYAPRGRGQAVRDGQFHIYPIPTIDEGISLLTGLPAGERQPDGSYPADTVNGTIHRNLREMANKVKAFAHPEEKKTKDEEG